MNHIKGLLFVFALVSMSSKAFEFNNSNAPYDFSQTAQIYIVDQKNSKLFAMFDPFEMQVTTVPSRFYVAVMGVVERGHKNAEGVSLIEGKAVDYEYELIFRSLNNSHVMFIGKSWIIDGNKRIALTKEEIVAIYDILLRRSSDAQKTDMNNLEMFFKEINGQQEAANTYPQLTADDELKSIVESKKTIEERLPESHNDMETLPYYNKAMENEKFLEEYEKTKQIADKNAPQLPEADIPVEIAANQNKSKTATSKVAPVPVPEEQSDSTNRENIVNTQEVASSKKYLLPVALIGLIIVLVYFALHKRRTNKSENI